MDLLFASSGAVSCIRLNDASFLCATSHAICQLRSYYYEYYTKSYFHITCGIAVQACVIWFPVRNTEAVKK